MSELPPTPARRRILVALDSARFGSLAARLAAELAAAWQGDVEGVFFENEDLLKLADLPFASEYCATTGLTRQLPRKALERMYRGWAEEIRQALNDACQPRHLRWSLEVRRQAAVRYALRQAGQADLVLIGVDRSSLRAAPRRPQTPAARQHVVVLCDGSHASRQALRIARQAFPDTLLQVLPIAADARKTAVVVAEVERELRPPWRICPPASPDVNQVLAALRRASADVVVSGWDVLPSALEQLVPQAGALLVLVGMTGDE